MQSAVKAGQYCATFFSIVFFISGCASTETGAKSASLSQLNSQLGKIVSDNQCTASFQCKVLEVGARSCGGPSKYVVYSSLNTKQEDAENLAHRITELEKSQNNSLAECLPVLPVQSLCLANQCQIITTK